MNRLRNEYWTVDTEAVCYNDLEVMERGSKGVRLVADLTAENGKPFRLVVATLHMACAKSLGGDLALEIARV